MFHVGRQTDRQVDMTKFKPTFLNFANVLNKREERSVGVSVCLNILTFKYFIYEIHPNLKAFR